MPRLQNNVPDLVGTLAERPLPGNLPGGILYSTTDTNECFITSIDPVTGTRSWKVFCESGGGSVAVATLTFSGSLTSSDGLVTGHASNYLSNTPTTLSPDPIAYPATFNATFNVFAINYLVNTVNPATGVSFNLFKNGVTVLNGIGQSGGFLGISGPNTDNVPVSVGDTIDLIVTIDPDVGTNNLVFSATVTFFS